MKALRGTRRVVQKGLFTPEWESVKSGIDVMQLAMCIILTVTEEKAQHMAVRLG